MAGEGGREVQSRSREVRKKSGSTRDFSSSTSILAIRRTNARNRPRNGGCASFSDRVLRFGNMDFVCGANRDFWFFLP